MVTCSRGEAVRLHCVVPCLLPALLPKRWEMPGSKQVGPSAIAGIGLLWSKIQSRNSSWVFLTKLQPWLWPGAKDYRCGQRSAVSVPRCDQPFAFRGAFASPWAVSEQRALTLLPPTSLVSRLLPKPFAV